MPANNKQRSRSRERPPKEQERVVGQDHDETNGFARGGEDSGGDSDAQPTWRERAAFDVAFDYSGDNGTTNWRTRAYHNESDATTEWPGIAGAPLVSWMREQGDLPEADAWLAPPEQSAAELPPYGDDSLEGATYGDDSLEGTAYGDGSLEGATYGDGSDVGASDKEEVATGLIGLGAPPASVPAGAGLSLGEIYLLEVASETRRGQSTGRRLRGQISFTMADEAGIQATLREAPYIVQFQGYDLHTGEQHVLGTEWACLEPFVDRYTCTTEFDLPAVGRYRILASVILPGEGLAGLAMGPVLTVVV